MQPLIDALRSGNVILFVGAGVSMNVGLPSWKSLIDEIAKMVDYDPDIFSSLGDHLTLAEYYFLMTGSLGSLRSWMDVVVRRLGLKSLPLLPSHQTRHLMAKAAVTVYEAAVENQGTED